MLNPKRFRYTNHLVLTSVAVVVTPGLLVACLFTQLLIAQESGQPEGTCKFVDHQALLLLEASDITSFIDRIGKTDAVSHSGWTQFHRLLVDEHHGLIDKSAVSDVVDIWQDCLAANPREVFFWVQSTDPLKWACTVSVSEPNLIDDVREFGFVATCLANRITSTNALPVTKPQLDDLLKEDFTSTTEGEIAFSTHADSGFSWFVSENRLVMGNDKAHLAAIAKRMRGTSEPYRSFSDSRKYKTVNRLLYESGNSGGDGIRLQLNPALLNAVGKQFTLELWEQLGLQELVNAGASIQIAKVKADDSFQLAVNSFIMLTRPRAGIASGFRPSGETFDELPAIPDSFVSYWSTNYDPLHYENTMEKLGDEVIEALGSRSRFSSIPARFRDRLPPGFYENVKIAKTAGKGIHGNCFFLDKARNRHSSFRFEKTDPESTVLFDATFEILNSVASAFSGPKNIRTEITGYPAVLRAARSKGASTGGFMQKGSWVFMGEKSFLELLAGDDVESSIGTEEVGKAMSHLQNALGLEGVVMAQAATRSSYWREHTSTFLFNELSKKSSISEETLRKVVQIESFNYKPESVEETKRYLLLVGVEIMIDSFGNGVGFVVDHSAGFQFGAMTWQWPGTLPTRSDSRDSSPRQE